MIKIYLVYVAVILSFLVGRVEATQITFTGNSATSGAMGNTRAFTMDGVTVTATAESMIGGVGAWQPSYLGLYSTGLGVTNSVEGSGANGTHTVDNLSSYDRVRFTFSTAVVLDTVGLTAYGDTDLMAIYKIGANWSVPEINMGSSTNRIADINAAGVASSTWIIAPYYAATSLDDSFKIINISFTRLRTTIPDTGGTLMLLAFAVATLFYFRAQTAAV